MTTNKRIALVTGAGEGMGRATSLRLAKDGFAVVALDINQSNAEIVASLITESDGTAIAICADISERQQLQAAHEKIQQSLGRVSVLVNNAGVEDFTPFLKIDDRNWDKQIDVNLKGNYLVTQTFLPDMQAQKWGRIINISSLGAQIGSASMVHYTAAKGGIIAMTRSLALEFGRDGITVNTVAPGFIDTPMARRAINSGRFPVSLENMVTNYPIPRLGKPEEIAAACSFFASEDAGYITAQLLGVNGGTSV